MTCLYINISFVDPKRMVLATRSVSTEKIPSRSHEVETEKRRVLVRDTSSEPSTSTGVRSSAPTTLEALLK